MITSYDSLVKDAMIAHLELLTIKAIIYSWVRVRAFHTFIAKQVEQRRLDWQDLKAIQDKATTFFRHSDLRNLRPRNESPRHSSASASGNHQQAATPTVTDAAFAKATILCYTALNVVPQFLHNDRYPPTRPVSSFHNHPSASHVQD